MIQRTLCNHNLCRAQYPVHRHVAEFLLPEDCALKKSLRNRRLPFCPTPRPTRPPWPSPGCQRCQTTWRSLTQLKLIHMARLIHHKGCQLFFSMLAFSFSPDSDIFSVQWISKIESRSCSRQFLGKQTLTKTDRREKYTMSHWPGVGKLLQWTETKISVCVSLSAISDDSTTQ